MADDPTCLPPTPAIEDAPDLIAWPHFWPIAIRQRLATLKWRGESAPRPRPSNEIRRRVDRVKAPLPPPGLDHTYSGGAAMLSREARDKWAGSALMREVIGDAALGDQKPPGIMMNCGIR